jgi:hypothetical protein
MDDTAGSLRNCRGWRHQRLPKATTEFTETQAGPPGRQVENFNETADMRVSDLRPFPGYGRAVCAGVPGPLSGRVLDPIGAAVPSAHVTLTNITTNIRLTTDTNAKGNYTIPYLQPGTYS